MVQRLMELGCSEYESRAYLALLTSHPATAYEVAREAGLPTSKIYQVIGKLEARGMVHTVMEGGKKRHVPIRPEEFIGSQRRRMESTLDSLRSDLARAHRASEVSYIWNVREQRHLMEKAERMARDCRRELLVSIWGTELAILEGALREAAAGGVRIAMVLFSPPDTEAGIGTVFPHPIEDTIYNEKGGRGLTMVADSEEALIGTIANDGSAEGAWSMNAGFVTLAEDYIKHDVYIMKIVSRFDDALIERFGRNYRLLRDIFSDREVRHGNA
ncbi:MAG: TrmB family transcriptional regulator [Spirochaetes bacterium]|nr:TrmB family transcriptional regulator [Spirochaetota bacterium]